MRIGFDFDGVLYPWTIVAYNWAVLNYGVKEDMVTFFNELDSPKYTKIFVQNLMEYPLYRSITPYKGAVETAKKLSEDNTLYYITLRPSSAEVATASWLKQYDFPQRHNLFIVKDKTDLIRTLRLDYYIEDRVSIATKIKNLTNVILVKTPWNVERRGEFEYVVDDVRGALEIINGNKEHNKA